MLVELRDRSGGIPSVVVCQERSHVARKGLDGVTEQVHKTQGQLEEVRKRKEELEVCHRATAWSAPRWSSRRPRRAVQAAVRRVARR